MLAGLPDEGFARRAVPLLKEGFSPASVGSVTWTIIGTAHTARAKVCFMKLLAVWHFLNGQLH